MLLLLIVPIMWFHKHQLGRVLWQEFFNNRDWPVASAVAMSCSCC